MAVHHASTLHLVKHLRADAIDFFCAPASTSHSSLLGGIHTLWQLAKVHDIFNPKPVKCKPQPAADLIGKPNPNSSVIKECQRHSTVKPKIIQTLDIILYLFIFLLVGAGHYRSFM